MLKAAEAKMTLKQFVANTTVAYGWNADTIQQKYYKYLKELKTLAADAKDAKRQEDAKLWLSKLELQASGETFGRGRKKVDRLASLNALRAKLGTPMANPVANAGGNNGNVGQQTVGQIALGQGTFMEQKDHKITITSGHTKITIDADANSEETVNTQAMAGAV